jgi:hypothetical protein
MKKTTVSIALSLALSGCVAPKEISYNRYDVSQLSIDERETVFIKVDTHSDVQFQGMYDYDDIIVGAPRAVYGSDGYGGLIEGIASQRQNNAAKYDAQAEANKVLLQYQEYLQQFEGGELLLSVLEELDKAYDFKIKQLVGEASVEGWILSSEPVFFMTQNQRELALRHGMYITSTDNPDHILHRNMVEILSAKSPNENAMQYWIEDNMLPIVAGELYAQSVQLFIADALDKYNGLESDEQTFRFTLGGENQFERGFLVEEECGQTTIKTLRGGFKIFPTQPAPEIQMTDGDVSVGSCTNFQFINLEQTITFPN